MAKLVVLADTHIPDRAEAIPSPILAALLREAETADIAVHAGDFTSREVLDWSMRLASEVYVVKGNMDYLDLPSTASFELEGLKFSVVHGHQVYPRGDLAKLSRVARRLGSHILISAHTHSPFIKLYEGILHLNPGSLTGVWGGGGGSMKPSFMVINLEGDTIEVILYELEGSELVARRESLKSVILLGPSSTSS